VASYHSVFKHVARSVIPTHGDAVITYFANDVEIGYIGAEIRSDNDILIRHVEGVAFGVIAAEGAVVDDVAEEIVGRGQGVAEREAHRVAVARIKNVVVEDARAITGDAAHVVGSVGACILHGDVFARRDGELSLALRRAEGAGVVAVADSGAVAGEGGAGIAVASLHLGLALLKHGGGVKRVADGDGVGAPADEATAVGGGRHSFGEELAVEHAALDGEEGILVVIGDDAAMCAVAAVAAVDVDAAAAVADDDLAVLAADDSGGVLAGGVDVARYVQVLDDAVALHVTERGDVRLGGVIFGLAVVEGQRVALAVKRAHEVMVLTARHAGHADVGIQLHNLAAEAVPIDVVIEGEAEGVPVIGIADGVGVLGGAVVACAKAVLDVFGL